jgi:hypothetical protein
MIPSCRYWNHHGPKRPINPLLFKNGFHRWIRLNPMRSTAAFTFLFAAMQLYLKAIDLTSKRSLLSGRFQKHGKA